MKNYIEKLKSDDKSKIKAVLNDLRREFVKNKKHDCINMECYRLILIFLKDSDFSVVSSALSLLAYCCLYEKYRDNFFHQTSIEDLKSIINLNSEDAIQCRAWRLIGNLMRSQKACSKLANADLFVEKLTVENLSVMSDETRNFFTRALRNGWPNRIHSLEICNQMFEILASDNLKLIRCILNLINSFGDFFIFHINENGIKILLKLHLNNNKDIKNLAELVLIKIHRFCEVPTTMIMSVTHIYIEMLQKQPEMVDSYAIMFMVKYSQHSNVRNAIKHSNLLPVVINKAMERKNSRIIDLLFNFRFDNDILQIFAQNDKFVLYITECGMASEQCASVLVQMIRSVGVPCALNTPQLLQFLTSHKIFLPVLSELTRRNLTPKFLISNNFVWKFSELGVNLENFDINSIKSALIDAKSEEEVVNYYLAVPFFSPVSDYPKMKTLLDDNGLKCIIERFRDKPDDPKVISVVVRLASFFRTSGMEFGNHWFFFKPKMEKCKPLGVWKPVKLEITNPVSLKCDNGTFSASKEMLTSISSVFEAMFCGNFVETKREYANFPNCTTEALSALVDIMTGKTDFKNLTITERLDLLLLSDRLLIKDLDEFVVRTYTICDQDLKFIYNFSRNQGGLLDSKWIKKLIHDVFWRILGTTSALSASICPILINDVIEWFTECIIN